MGNFVFRDVVFSGGLVIVIVIDCFYDFDINFLNV